MKRHSHARISAPDRRGGADPKNSLVPGAQNDFAREKTIRCRDVRESSILRSRLWMLCVVVVCCYPLIPFVIESRSLVRMHVPP